MSEGSGQPQRFCTNCGAEIRAGNSFCVSCGRPVNGGPASPGPDYSAPPPPTPPQQSLADTLRKSFSGLTRLFSNASSPTGRTSISELPNRLINWFRDLPSVPKLILVGVLLLLLLTVLSPVARVVAIIVFVVSAIALVIRAIQRGPIKGWGVAAVSSFVLIFVFGGISSVIYGNLLGVSNDGKPSWAASDGEETDPLLVVFPSSSSVPYYEIAGTDLLEEGTSTVLFVRVKTEATDREELHEITADIGQQAYEKYYGDYDFLNMRLCSPDQFGVAGEPEDDCNESTAAARVSLSSQGEAFSDLAEGQYDVSLSSDPKCNEGQEIYADDEGLHRCEEEDYGSAEDEGGSSSEGGNAGVLESMLRGGMMDGDEAIEDVRISGESAVVVVASDVSEEYAQSVCDFALSSAQSYDSQSSYGDSLGITQVSVKRPWRPWNAASCSL